jgi:hypothetical protein
MTTISSYPPEQTERSSVWAANQNYAGTPHHPSCRPSWIAGSVGHPLETLRVSLVELESDDTILLIGFEGQTREYLPGRDRWRGYIGTAECFGCRSRRLPSDSPVEWACMQSRASFDPSGYLAPLGFPSLGVWGEMPVGLTVDRVAVNPKTKSCDGTWLSSRRCFYYLLSLSHLLDEDSDPKESSLEQSRAHRLASGELDEDCHIGSMSHPWGRRWPRHPIESVEVWETLVF